MVTDRLSSLTRHRSTPLLLGTTVAVVSWIAPLSYDEGYWLAITRMVASGANLYDTAIDNNSPIVYAIVWVIDAAPGAFEHGRALVIGALVAVMAALALKRDPNEQTTVYLIAGGCALMASFQLQTELLAAPLVGSSLIGALAGRAMAAGFLAVAATAITPLAGMTIPMAIFLSRRHAATGVWLRASATTAAITAAILTGILMHPNLRYGLVE